MSTSDAVSATGEVIERRLPGISVYRGPALVAAATFFFWSSLYLYVPILPLHAEHLGSSLQMVGAIIAAYAIGQVLLRIPLGIGGDVYGRKPFAVLSLALAAAGAAWLGIAGSPTELFAARTLTGFAAAGWVVISVLFASYYRKDSSTVAMSIIMAVNTSSLLVSTFVGGILADWLGNVRELANALEHAVILSDGKTIKPEDLPSNILRSARANGAASVPFQVTGDSKTLREIERDVILQTLDRNGGDKPSTAKELGIALKTLYNKLNQYEATQAA